MILFPRFFNVQDMRNNKLIESGLKIVLRTNSPFFAIQWGTNKTTTLICVFCQLQT